MAQRIDPRLGPAGSGRRLRADLRRAREAAGLTQEHAARELDWHLSKVIRIETGTSGVAATDLRAMLALYGVGDAAVVAAMVCWAKKARERMWWHSYKQSIGRSYAYFIALEYEAVALRTFQPVLVPGLLQIPEYSRAVSAQFSNDEVAGQATEIRIRRQQEAFGRADPLRMTAVLDESVLHRAVGSAQILCEQLRHLAAMATRPYVRLHVVPFVATERPYMSEQFSMLDFDGPDADTMVYTEAFRQNALERREDVTFYQGVYESLRGAALSAGESRQLVEELADAAHRERG